MAETNQHYCYIAAGSAYTADDVYILTTANGGNTRWVSLIYPDIVTHSATEATTADKMRGQDHIITGAYTVTLPAAVVGMQATFISTTAAVFSLDSNGADQFILAGTALTAGYKITSDGTAGVVVTVKCLQANKWYVTYTNSTMIDGGA